jgi:hypothetical protein
MLLIMLIGCTLIPVPVSMDVRGWHEMHPLNGPGWSLFFEYIVNILYALFVRKFSNTLLAVLVFISGCALIHLAVAGPNGDVIGGWSLEPMQIRIGITRVMFPFFGGLLLSRITKTTQIKNAFLWCSLLLIIILAVPRIGGTEHLWMNGIYVSQRRNKRRENIKSCKIFGRYFIPYLYHSLPTDLYLYRLCGR